MLIIKYIISILFSYIIGSIPTAYILGKINKIDIRQHGSGNIGTTNVFRVLGKKWGIITLFSDILKGYIPVIIISLIFKNNYISLVSAISAVLGHSFTIFLNFKGGKGVATSAGVLIALTPFPMLITIIGFIIILLIFRYVSLASICGSLIYLITVILANQPKHIRIMALILALLIIVKHKSNIKRLLSKTENKIF